MYELLLLLIFAGLALRAFQIDESESVDLPHKISGRIGRLWDIVHQGMRENRLVRAEKALLAILKIDEKNAAAYNRLGILYAKQKEFKDAIDCFEIACSIEPSAPSLHNLGLVYYETENYERAATAFEEALKLEDSMAARHIALAKALEYLGNNKQMVNHLEKAVEIEPTKESYKLLIQGYRKTNEQEKADLLEDKLSKLITSTGSKKRFRVQRAKRVVI
ncbi:MAG TPA: tetratricopeptide repeat protein [Candidatus Saccharimonadales bacterium]|nr:tetratricopeptide repeat protein [Candidatus Saccharimonadales bacterium]